MRPEFLLLLLALVGQCFAGELVNWTGPYEPCSQHSELTKKGHMNLGVRFETLNPVSATAFRQALRFWSQVLDFDYHDDPSSNCALAIVDATPAILSRDHDVARAQFTDWRDFQGWVAFDPHISSYMSPQEVFATAVHELGHLFGLVHSSDSFSVMYFLDVESNAILDAADLRALAARHAMRSKLPERMELSGYLPIADRRSAPLSGSTLLIPAN